MLPGCPLLGQGLERQSRALRGVSCWGNGAPPTSVALMDGISKANAATALPLVPGPWPRACCSQQESFHQLEHTWNGIWATDTLDLVHRKIIRKIQLAAVVTSSHVCGFVWPDTWLEERIRTAHRSPWRINFPYSYLTKPPKPTNILTPDSLLRGLWICNGNGTRRARFHHWTREGGLAMYQKKKSVWRTLGKSILSTKSFSWRYAQPAGAWEAGILTPAWPWAHWVIWTSTFVLCGSLEALELFHN